MPHEELPTRGVLTLEIVRYDWPAIAGETLNGRYVLASFESENAGVGRFVSGGRFVDLLPSEAADAAQAAARWQFLSSVSHPNLLTVLETGKADLAGVNVVYCVTERPDDSVAGVIAERSLSPEEVDQIVDAVLPALGHLSARGAVYTRLAAPYIVAVGEQVKLALEPVEPAGDRTGRPWRRADIEDVLRGQAVPGFTLKPAATPPPPAPRRSAVAVPPPVQKPEPPKAAPAAARAAQPLPPTPTPQVQTPPPTPPPVLRPAHPGVPPQLSTVRKVALAGTALLVLLVLFQVFRTRDSEPAPTVDQTRSSPIAPAPAPEAQRPVAPAAAAHAVRGWSVIVGAYGREADARKRAASLAPKWPHGQIRVIRSKGRYLLVAGTGFTSKADADRLRRQARAAGLSRSTYVTKL